MTEKPDKVHARLFVHMAKDSSKAIVFRRGPSKQVCTFLWRRDQDTFELGQWLKGRIYERRSDISPDGKYCIYFAADQSRWHGRTRGTWTAVSRTPWLRALALYAKGDTWNGGGFFTSNNEYILNHPAVDKQDILEVSSEVNLSKSKSDGQKYGNECLGVYFPNLMRRGWSLIETEQITSRHSKTVFEKNMNKHWVLRKHCHGSSSLTSRKGRGVYWDEHELVNRESDISISKEEWEWADIDKNMIVFAAHGCLYRLRIKSQNKLGEPKLLHDFNDYKFTEIRAPYDNGWTP